MVNKMTIVLHHYFYYCEFEVSSWDFILSILASNSYYWSIPFN